MKRFFDLLVALVALLLLSPLLTLVALAVWWSSRGPVLFRQVRIGLGGRPFTIFKFRTMDTRRATLANAVTAVGDPRITRVGSFLRKSKLDELPQLLNVVRGDMSLVGPRPDVPEVVATYPPELRGILGVRPGLTSNASVELVDEEALIGLAFEPERFYLEVVVPAKVAKAMEHVERRSFSYDLQVMWDTVRALLPFGSPPAKGELSLLLHAAVQRWNREHGEALDSALQPVTSGDSEGTTS